jgi:hypothetical protein
MKRFARFFQVINGKNMELLGSEGVYILDARNSTSTSISDCIERMNKLKNVHGNLSGFIIYRAERFSDTKNILTGKFFNNLEVVK